jgi:hypothetical protein
MNWDLSHLLDKWDYQPGQVIVRRFKGKDGAEKLQLRVDLGILQMNVEGRPDGKRPLGQESLYEHFLGQLTKHKESHGGVETGFTLSAEDCSRLQQEAIQYHHRYICLLQLEDYKAVLRDTTRNLEVFDFVSQFAATTELSWALEQFRPQLIMMQTRALGELALQSDDFDAATSAIESGLDGIRSFFREHARLDLAEDNSEILSLETWLQQVRERRPLSELERLENALHEAVRREDFEKAAEMRDALKKLRPSSKS